MAEEELDEQDNPDDDETEEDVSHGLTDGSWWVQTYDEKGNAYTTPQPFTNLRKEVIEEWLAAVKRGDINSPTMTPELLEHLAWTEFTVHVGKARGNRSKQLVEVAQYLLEALPEDGIYVDPILNQVHRVGDRTDAPLRYWTVEMWETWSDLRLKKAKQTIDAAYEAMKIRQQIVENIREAHVTQTGDLYASHTHKNPDGGQTCTTNNASSSPTPSQ
jgi:hypothetical protein